MLNEIRELNLNELESASGGTSFSYVQTVVASSASESALAGVLLAGAMGGGAGTKGPSRRTGKQS